MTNLPLGAQVEDISDMHPDFKSRLIDLAELLPGLGWIGLPNGDFLYHSKALVALTGMPTEEQVRRDENGDFNWKATVEAEEYERLSSAWLTAVRTERDLEVTHRIRAVDGTFRWLRSQARPQRDDNGKVIYWLGISIDIHEAMTAMEESLAKESRLAKLIDAVPSPLWAAAANGEPTHINRALAEQTGIAIDDLANADKSVLSQAIAKAIHPDDAENVNAALQHSFLTGTPFKLKYRQLRADGRYGWISGQANALRDADGIIVQWYGVCQDIDEEVLAHEALREREARVRLAVDALPGLVWMCNPEGEPTYYNRRLENWSGVGPRDILSSRKTLLSTAIRMIIHPDDQTAVERSMRASFISGEPWIMRFRQRRADGVWRWMEGRMEALRAKTGEITQWYGLELDIDEELRGQESLRLAQEKLARAAQYAAMAELSASIAHEVSQPLASVVASADAGRRWMEMSPPNLERARMSAESVLRDANIASDVVKRVRALFQNRAYERHPEDLNKIVVAVCDILNEELTAAGVAVEQDLFPDLPVVVVDGVHIQQVLVNLFRNAVEAMSEIASHSKSITVRTLSTSDGVTVEVEDTGPGIADVDRIFNPFFTTKADGMGMGLSICRSVLYSHNGRLWAENTGGGAKISFTLRSGDSEDPRRAEGER